MKKKSFYFLLFLCSFLLIGGKAYAEGEEVESTVNYKSYCKQYSDDESRLLCCNSEPDEQLREECKKPVYDNCIKLDSLQERYVCCNKYKSKVDNEACTRLANEYCGSADSVALSKEASNVKIVYEPFEYKPDGFDDENSPNFSLIYYMIDVKIYNATSHMYIEVDNGSKTYNVGIDQMNTDGVIVIRSGNASDVKKYTFKIYADSASCKGKLLRTVQLTLPKYNYYSGKSACDDIPEYYLCHQYVNFDVDGNTFLKNTEAYKAKLSKTSSSTTKDKDKKTTVNKTLSSISDNKIYVIGGILLIGVVVTVLILRRRNS